MKIRMLDMRFAVGLLVIIIISYGVGCDRAPNKVTPPVQDNLDIIIKARTEALMLQQDVNATVTRQLSGQAKNANIVIAVQKIIAKANAKLEEGNLFLTKDMYSAANISLNEATILYRKALDWRKVETEITKAEHRAIMTRLVSEALGPTNDVTAGIRSQMNAEGYLEAGEIDKAIHEYTKACNVFESFIPGVGSLTLDGVIAARTAMLNVRKQVKNLSEYSSAKEIKPDILADAVERALKAEQTANNALEERNDAYAYLLFGIAEKYFNIVLVIEGVKADYKNAEEEMKGAVTMLKDGPPPIAIEQAKRVMIDAEKSLAEGEFEVAKNLITQATVIFKTAHLEMLLPNDISALQKIWATSLTTVDATLMDRNARAEFVTAKAKAETAQNKVREGQSQLAVSLLKESIVSLQLAIATAKDRENSVKVTSIIAKLTDAITMSRTSEAETLLAELATLTQNDAQIRVLREKIAALPKVKNNSGTNNYEEILVDLGSSVTLEMVWISPGEFLMGSPTNEFGRRDNESPQHRVKITQGFWMGKYEVTQGQYRQLMGIPHVSARNTNPNAPVDTIDWNQAKAFCEKLKAKLSIRFRGKMVRLPTEAEWEYACRAGTIGPYAGKLDDMGWNIENSGNTSHLVGQKHPNSWGLYDMHGNLWEWCWDGTPTYTADAQIDPINLGRSRIMRGGSWYTVADGCRSAQRNLDDPTHRGFNFGFRVIVGSEIITDVNKPKQTFSPPVLLRPVKSSKELTVVPNVGIAGIYLDSSKADVEKVFGKPNITIAGNAYYERLGLDLLMTNDVVKIIAFHKPFAGHTKEGVKLGSLCAEVFKAYGEPVEENRHWDYCPKDKVLQSNCDVKHIYYDDQHIKFIFYGGKLGRMEMFLR